MFLLYGDSILGLLISHVMGCGRSAGGVRGICSGVRFGGWLFGQGCH